MKNFYPILLTVSCTFSFALNSNGQGNPKFASRDLSNLTSPTAVNTDLLPDLNKKLDLGSSSHQWDFLYVNNLKNSGNANLGGSLVVTGLTTVNAVKINGAVTVKGINAGIIKANANGELRSELLTVSDIPSLSTLYLPLKGGTLTGGIKGTSASFSGTGIFKYIETGNLKVNSGTPALGNVLTADSNGMASWQSPTSSGWSLTGNSGTVDGINFIGTTDDVPLTFKVNGVLAGRIDEHWGNAIWGYAAGPNAPSSEGGYANTAIGNGALPGDGYNGGCCNTATGVTAMMAGSNRASYNTANGMESGGGNGSYNTTMGYEALMASQGGSYNTAIGTMADIMNNGSFNTAVGFQALYSGSGTGLTVIGYDADVFGSNIQYSSAIGTGAFVWQSGQVSIGGFIPSSVGGFVNWSDFSDGRYKKNIQQNVPGLEFINMLKPITYTLDVNAIQGKMESKRNSVSSKNGKIHTKPVVDPALMSAKSQTVYTGFSAQEVEAAAKKINYDFSGVDKPKDDPESFYSLRYGDFVVPLVKAVQELSSKNDSLEATNAQLNDRLNKIEQLLGITNTTGNSSAVILSSAKLFQNSPNPFNNSTVISYFLPDHFASAKIEVTDWNGLIIKSIPIQSKGSGQITLETPQLSSGTYTYRLIVDGNLTDTKKMVLIK
jgi:trimeric autotransporter adhesin